MLSAGWTLDDILNLTWDQTAFVAECVVRHKQWQVEMILEPISAALGGGYKKGRVSKSTQAKNRAARKNMKPETRDALLMAQIGEFGFDISTQSSSTKAE